MNITCKLSSAAVGAVEPHTAWNCILENGTSGSQRAPRLSGQIAKSLTALLSSISEPPVLSYLTCSSFCLCLWAGESLSVFPQVSSDRWAVYQVQGLIFLSLVYRGKPIPLISYPCLSTWQAVGRDCSSQHHRHFQWLLTAMSSDGNEPFPAQRKELLGSIRGGWGLFTAFLNWRCQRDVNLMLPNIKHKIPLMTVAVTRVESQWHEGAHKSPWRWGQALQENNEIHSLSLEDI